MKKRLKICAVAAGILYLCVGYSVDSANPRTMLKRIVASVRQAPTQIKFSAEIVPGNSEQRVYLIHGLDQGPDFWNAAPYDKITKYFKASGAQIIIVQLPHISMIDLKGSSYCAAFSSWFDRIQTFLGPERETTVVGASWGGWHAMQIGSKADRMLLLKPVTRPNLLDEYWQAEPSKCQLGRSRDSMAIFAPTDPRVGDATKALTGWPTKRATLGDHRVVAQDIEAAIIWLDEDGVKS